MCEYTNKAYEDAIVYLKTSPMFNLSLSSKELFHSNFLYWLSTIDKNKSIFKGLVTSLGADISGWNDNTWEVKREFKNLDVCVIDKEGKILLVVENKVKSIPTITQLDSYNVTIKNNNKKDLLKKNKVLLSLTKPEFQLNSWVWKGYDSIITYLTGLKGKLCDYEVNEDKVSYYNQIIIDYTEFISALLFIVNEWKDNDFKLKYPYLQNYKSKEDIVETDVDYS
ncbi:MAG: PD-(D/E)XK nuclease family protein, partial [Alistipes sp.]|nr:PD-(D/E)XK nuclease family protein [Alistipes sp.]